MLGQCIKVNKILRPAIKHKENICVYISPAFHLPITCSGGKQADAHEQRKTKDE